MNEIELKGCLNAANDRLKSATTSLEYSGATVSFKAVYEMNECIRMLTIVLEEVFAKVNEIDRRSASNEDHYPEV